MITFVVPRRAPVPLTDYVEVVGPRLSCDLTREFYDDWAGRREFAPGTYVFAGMEWLDAPMLAFISRVRTELDGRDGIRFLNDPLRTLGRYDLLAELSRLGHNDFRARRLSEDLGDVRFPAFVRSERDHNGALSPLVNSQRGIEQAVGLAICGGYKPADLLVMEFCDTSNDDGLFRKYSAFVVNGRIIPRNLNVTGEWMVKHARTSYGAGLAREEHDYVLNNPHREQLAAVAALARADYGRIDYTFRGDRMQVWEINLNPTIGRLRKPRTFINAAVHELRAGTNAFFYEQLNAAIEAIDLPSTGTPFVVSGAAPLMRGWQSVRVRFERVNRVARFMPFVDSVLGIGGRIAIDRMSEAATEAVSRIAS